jgi:hypothetical protein
MNSRQLLLGCLLVVVCAATGCSRNLAGGLTGVSRRSTLHTGQDSLPTPPPPHTDPAILPVQFLGSDSVASGHVSLTRWRVGNDSSAAFTLHWDVHAATDSASGTWPGFPITGTVEMAAMSVRDVQVGVPVPEGAHQGFYLIAMSVTRPGGAAHTEAEGGIRVYSGVLPPPPPPPPAPIVVFAGADSARVGAAQTFWFVHNEDAPAYSAAWTLESTRNWPGFPINGTTEIGAYGQTNVAIGIVIPDSAAAGLNQLTLSVTRPNGLPDASGSGPVWLEP